VLLVTLGYGGLGFLDDWLKVTKRNSKGVSARQKLVAQGVIGLAAAVWFAMLLPAGLDDSLALPFFKEALIPSGWPFPLVGMFVMVGASNAVNLTDGLDGLAIVPVMIAAAVFALIAYLVGNRIFADYLQLHAVPGRGTLPCSAAALIGACSASCGSTRRLRGFMGRHRLLCLRRRACAVAVATKHEVVLAIVGGLFVVRRCPVGHPGPFWFKRTEARRVFLMAPLHHNISRRRAWAEATIVIRSGSSPWCWPGRPSTLKIDDPADARPDAPFLFAARIAVVGLGKAGLPAARTARVWGAA
jgi:phospho-N-acetylmuramoyl-pentapeptide-transferase